MRKMVGRENQNAEIGTENIVEINYQSPEVATTTQSQGNVQEGAWALPTVSTACLIIVYNHSTSLP